MRISLLVTASFIALLCGSGQPISYTWAADTQQNASPSVAVRIGVHPDFDRVVFDFPRSVAYSLKQEADRATLTFKTAAKLAFDAAGLTRLERAHNFSSSTNSEGQLVVSFTVDAKAQLHAFTSGNSVAVDVKAAAPTEAPKPSPAKVEPPKPNAAKPENKSPETKAPDTPPKIEDPSNGEGKQSPEPQETKATQAPEKLALAAHNGSPNATAPNATPPKASAPAPITASAASTAKATPPEKITPAPQTPAPTKTVPVINAPTITPPAPAATLASTQRKEVSNLVVGDTPVLAMALDPHTPTRAAIFVRAGYAYIILNRKITIAPADLITADGANRITVEPIDLAKATAYRFAMPHGIDLHVAHEGTAWKIFLSHQSDEVPVSTTFIAQPDFALGSRLLLPLPDAPEPLRFTDPIVGDDLILVPLGQSESFTVPRSMSDFKVIPAEQGMVIKPLTDHVIVRTVTDGIEITSEGGLRLSSVTDTGGGNQSTQRSKAAEIGKSIFDFAGWSGKPGESYTQTRQRLMQTIVDVPEAERNRARLELARFYFAHGNGHEAMSMLHYLAKELPDLLAHADFSAMLGASEILAHRPEDGLKRLELPGLVGQPEIDLWQAVAAAELRDWKNAEEKFMVAETVLYGYPEPFRSRFSVLAVESAIAVDNDHEAADWLDRLDNGEHPETVNPAIHYLYAALHAKAGRAQSAENAWSMAADSNDRLYKVRAEMALVDLRVATGSLTAAHAADRLEALRFGWRGDDLEVDILHRLGQFYIQAKSIKSGLATMAHAVRLYPSSPMTPAIKTEMSKIFHDVFLSDLGASLSPLDALTLYQQYRELMPSGADGDIVMRNLAERLVEVDLLDQASSLLEELIKTRLQGEDKVRTSSRLAAIRLLDHKPDQALTALDMGGGGFMQEDVQNERSLLRAKALSEMQKDDDALALLHGNDHESAKLLRADITMHAHRWDEAAKALLEIIGSPPLPGNVLSSDQADWLLNCAIAYSMAGNSAALDRLAIDYGAAMAGTKQNDTFRVLTSPEKATQMRDITTAQSRIADVDMFQGFLNTYRKNNGDNAKDKAKNKDEKKL